jgi:cysteinyl-tRNA synthetase
VGLVQDRLRDAKGDLVDADWRAKLDEAKAHFEEAMDDDFNTPRAIATLFDLSREVNTVLNSEQPVSRVTLEAINSLYQKLGGEVLGLRFMVGATSGVSQAGSQLVDGLVRMLIDMRQEARQARNWAQADAIRDRLSALGVALEDGAEGTRWRLSR